METNGFPARDVILAAALRRFAAYGYAGASVQEIIGDTGYTKPTLYYYFQNKEGLYRALLDEAYDESYQRMRAAAAKSTRLERQLIELLTAVFEFLRDRKELTRLAFATAFAAPGELPASVQGRAKRKRNFNFVHGLIRDGLRAGALTRRFQSRELAYGIYGALSFHLMAHVLMPKVPLNRRTAERIVRLFLRGAGHQVRP